MHWRGWFDQIDTDEEGDNNFGTDSFYHDDSAIKYFKRLDKLGAKIEIGEYGDSVKLIMPKNKAKREQILLCILTTSPTPVDARYNKKKDFFELSW